MQALQWAIDDPEAMRRCVAICASAAQRDEHRLLDRRARRSCRTPASQGGAYHESGWGPPAVARMMAHITYLSEESFAQVRARAARRGRQPGLRPDFEVEHHLHHQGASFLSRFDALSYLTSRAPWTTSNAVPRRAPHGQLGNPTRFLAVSFSSDWRWARTRPPGRAAASRERAGTSRRRALGHDCSAPTCLEYHDAVRAFLAGGAVARAAASRHPNPRASWPGRRR